jgi:hypothetical protein
VKRPQKFVALGRADKVRRSKTKPHESRMVTEYALRQRELTTDDRLSIARLESMDRERGCDLGHL